MFGIGGGEWFVLGLVALFVFGPDKLPDMARQAGRMTNDVRRFVTNARRDLDSELGIDTSRFNATDLDPRTAIRRHVLEGLDEDAPAAQPGSTPTPPSKARAGEDPDIT